MAVYSYAELAGLWIEAGGSGSKAGTAAAIAEAESGGNPTRINNTAYPNLPGYRPPSPGASPEYSVGLWQINILAHPSYTKTEMLDPLENARAAVAISSDGRNFKHWTTYADGAYKQYLQANFVPTIPDLGPGLVSATGSLSATPAAASVQASRAWSRLMRELAVKVPARVNASTAARTRIRRAVR